MAGRITLEWDMLRHNQKKKWLSHAEAVLLAALSAE
jgi:hypothetical protein